ncbi:MAG: hypothetical protein ACOCQD_00305 [archaeon]
MALKKVEEDYTENESSGYPSTSEKNQKQNLNANINSDNGGFDEEKLAKLVSRAVKEANSSKEEDDELGVLPQGAKEFVQAAQGVEKVKSMFKSQYEQTIEDTVGQVMAQAVQQSLGTMMGAGQQQQSEPAQPPMGFWKQAGLMFMQNVSQEIPQYLPSILDTLKDVVGKDRIQKGYDAGVNYLETHQEMKNIPNIVMQLDAEDMEDVKEYAKMMGITNTSMAKQFLLEHQESLRQEYSEYQALQEGDYQRDSLDEEPEVEEFESEYKHESEENENPSYEIDDRQLEEEQTTEKEKPRPKKRYLKKSQYIGQDELKDMYDNNEIKIDTNNNINIPKYDNKINNSKNKSDEKSDRNLMKNQIRNLMKNQIRNLMKNQIRNLMKNQMKNQIVKK